MGHGTYPGSDTITGTSRSSGSIGSVDVTLKLGGLLQYYMFDLHFFCGSTQCSLHNNINIKDSHNLLIFFNTFLLFYYKAEFSCPPVQHPPRIWSQQIRRPQIYQIPPNIDYPSQCREIKKIFYIVGSQGCRSRSMPLIICRDKEGMILMYILRSSCSEIKIILYLGS